VSIEDEIVEWAVSRPRWQRQILRTVALGQAVMPEDIPLLVDRMISDRFDDHAEISAEDLPARANSGPCVRLLEVRSVRNVNALLQDYPLTFDSSGMTVVYGDNGSGKSGYARLIKQIVRARHSEPILTDIFTDGGSASPFAEVTIQIDDRRVDCIWPDQIPSEVGQMSFFDEACGDLYIASESEVTYRPSALFVLDGLIRACDLVRDELDKRLAANTRSARQLPMPHEGTQAERFLSSLSADTTDVQVDDICHLPPEADTEISRLASEEARLYATNPAREKQRLMSVAGRFSMLAGHLEECERVVGDPAVAECDALRDLLTRKKSAVELASAQSFDAEPLSGVGTSAWRELWEAARQFARHTCPEKSFPPGGPGARCPLCHQDLDDQATERLNRFESFVRDVTQRELADATQELKSARIKIESLVTEPPNILLLLEGMDETHSEVVSKYRAALAGYGSRKKALVEACRDLPRENSKLDPVFAPISDARFFEEEAHGAAKVVDESTFEAALRSTVRGRLELEARRTLAAARETIIAELHRLRARRFLEQNKDSTNTQGISRKAADLTRDHVTTIIRDRFTRESDRLKLERVTLEDVGGRKGTLQHQPIFVGAIQPAQLSKVLSEGEQTALGMAGFFTEAHLEASKSAIILDDPVSSLDHVRRGYVATRLATFAKERQVVIFTHDIAFVADLRLAAQSEAVTICERSIERRHSGQPGKCLPGHPWKARDVPQRLHTLEQELIRIRHEMNGWDQQRYEQETADWAGKLSETWERMINLEVVGKIVDRGTQEVRPQMFRVLVRITEADDREFQASYSRCSRWARRHDKSISVNYVAPVLGDMQGELVAVKQWWDRVRRYAQ
jgi:energy-coupling factor transporter ATP-binding protein EcfA2